MFQTVYKYMISGSFKNSFTCKLLGYASYIYKYIFAGFGSE